ncbi:MAG: DUF4175 family protein [Myxococcales bacterium]|nr:DUF4175 family protein [Myxococcales bacterium]MCB9644592.1 DUF4175 family protein [Myxococcales bacterium]
MASATITTEKQVLERFLRRVRRRCWTLGLIRGLTLLGTGICVLFFITGLWLWLSPPPFRVESIWATALLVSSVLAIFFAWRYAKKLQDEALSKALAQWAPETDGLLTALELARTLQDPKQPKHFSQPLAEARVQQVYRRLRNLNTSRLVPIETLRPQAYAFFGLASALFAFFALDTTRSSEILRRMFFPQQAIGKQLSMDIRGELLLGDLEVRYEYPAYTQLPPKTIPNSDGTLSALKGTTIRLHGRALYETSKAEINIFGKTEQSIAFKVGKDKRTLTAEFTLLHGGNYRIKHYDHKGNLRFGPLHNIKLELDTYPKLELIAPKADIEVREREKVQIVFDASDDFGLNKMSIIYKNLSSKRLKKEMVLPLKEWKENIKQDRGELTWDLATMPFTPGDRISYQLEVLDNDTISGPKRTRSAIRHLKIFSPSEAHEKLLTQQEALLKHMTLFLADLIERPDAQKSEEHKLKRQLRHLESSGDKILNQFRTLRSMMRDDSMTKPFAMIAMDTLQQRFSQRQDERASFSQRLTVSQMEPGMFRSGYEELQRDEVEPQEDDVHALALLLQRQRLDLIAQLSQQLSEAQNRLRELLDKYRKDKDPKTKAALLQEMRRIERLIEQIRQRMSQLNRYLPDEYLNSKAFKHKGALNALKRMKKHVKENNLEKAAEELSKLAQDIERMASQLDEMSKEAGGSSSKMNEAMKKMLEDIHQLEKQQSRLARRTEKIRQNISKRMQAALEKKVQQAVNKQLKRLEQLRKHVEKAEKATTPLNRNYGYNRAYKALKDETQQLERLLKAKDLFESQRSARSLESKNQRLESNFEMQERYSRMLQENLRNIRQSWRNDIDHQQSLQKRVKQLQERSKGVKQAVSQLQRAGQIAEQIRKDLENFFPSEKPYVSKKDQKQLQQNQRSQEQLRKIAQQLQQKMERMGRRIPMFSPKMQQKMREAGEQMGEAKEKLGQREPRNAHHAQERAAFKLKDLRKQMQKMMQQQGRASKQKQEKVEIPDASKHKAPKALRQDIIDAMKEKVPKPYREPVQRYYEKLVK